MIHTEVHDQTTASSLGGQVADVDILSSSGGEERLGFFLFLFLERGNQSEAQRIE